MNDVVRQMEPLARADANEHGLVLELELGADLPRVMGDGIQLQQVLLNLVRNGVDAMRGTNGGGSIVVRTATGGPGTIEIGVCDAGPPLDEAAFRHMFEPFYTTKPTGLGIGLSLSRSIVEAHGGLLWATRNAERGITMRFTLPCDG